MQSTLRSTINSTIIALLISIFSFSGASRVAAHPSNIQQSDESVEIARLTRALNSAEEDERLGAVLNLAATGSPAAVPALTRSANDSSGLVRAAAIDGLSLLADASVIPLVATHLTTDKDVMVRKTSAYALGKLQSRIDRNQALTPSEPRQATPALVASLNDKKDEVRGAAAVALGEYKDRAAVEPLTRSLKDKSDFVRAYAAHALGVNGRASAQAVPMLVNLLRSDQNLKVKREAAVALGLIGDGSALSALKEAQISDDPYLSRAALEAIEKIEKPAPK